jgi:hypothetical protein
MGQKQTIASMRQARSGTIFDFDHRPMPDNRYWMTCREYTWEVAVLSPDNSARRSIYVYEMMGRLGIDPAEGVVPRLSMAYMTAVRRCQACGT